MSRGSAMLALLLLLLAPASAEAGLVRLGDETTRIDLGPQLEVLRDPGGLLNVAAVRGGGPRWEPLTGTPSFGWTDDVHWFRTTLLHEGKEPAVFVLDVGYPLLDDVSIHVEETDGTMSATVTGDSRPFRARAVAHRDFLRFLPMEPGQRRELILRVATQGSLQVPVTVWSRETFEATDQRRQLATGLYYGLMLVMAIYNLFVFFAVRDADYLYYVLQVAAFVLLQATFDGITAQHLWPDAPGWNNVAVPFMVANVILWGALFTRRFCEVRRYVPWLEKGFYGLVMLSIGIAASAFLFPYKFTARFVAIAAVVGTAMAFGSGYWAWRHGLRQARYYVLAWTAFLGGTAMFALSKAGWIPHGVVTENAQQVGSVLVVIFVSFALADRVNFMKRRVEAQTVELEEKNRALEAHAGALQAADKQKTTFFQNVSHELRTPLTLILNPLEDMASEESYKPERRLAVASQNARRLLRLVNQLLDFQKIEAGKKTLHLSPVNLVAFLRSTAAYFGPACDAKGIRFRVVVGAKVVAEEAAGPEPIHVHAEIDALEKVLFNFLSNALKFTPDGGAIDLMLAVEGERVRVSVVDNGPGISPDDQKKLFRVFSQADGSTTRRYEGTGLGLALARELATAMGGEVGVSSRVGEGSTFWALFPRVTPEERPVLAPAVPANDQSFAFKAWHLADSSNGVTPADGPSVRASSELDDAGPRAGTGADRSGTIGAPMTMAESVETHMANTADVVLVVDDLPDMRTLVKDTLEREGMKVITAANGERALELAHRHKPDLIITDWMMPVMSGPELIRELKSDPEFFTTPIVLLTARSDEESRLTGTQVGADGFLGKPFEDREVVSLARNLLKLKSREKRVEELNRHLAENVLKRYLPPTLVDAILDGRISINQQPRSVAATILFCDLVSFTQAASKLRAVKMARVLNDYLGSMTNIIFQHGGTIDKFIGDAVMVIFGAPLELPPHQQIERAVACALAMQNAMDELNVTWRAQGIEPLSMRVGVHHGAVVVGNFGDTRRYDYTAIGPAVSAAVSLERACTPGEVFVSGEVYDHLPETAAVPAGTYGIKGVEGKLACFQLVRSQAVGRTG